jgi:hypothetical protein
VLENGFYASADEGAPPRPGARLMKRATFDSRGIDVENSAAGKLRDRTPFEGCDDVRTD